MAAKIVDFGNHDSCTLDVVVGADLRYTFYTRERGVANKRS